MALSPLPPFRAFARLATPLLTLLLAAGCSGGGSDGGGGGSGGPTPPTGTVTDTDRDGMSDEEEATPRTLEIVISVAGNAAPPTVELRVVVGDPTRVDADGDGVDDATELRNGSDPHAVDTDGDGRTDAEELRGYRILVDAGGWGTGLTGELLERRDVTGDPAKNDGDGDGLLDDEEFELRTDPLATLPLTIGASGTGTLPIPLPLVPELTVRTHFVQLVGGTNPTFTASQGLLVKIAR